MDLPRSDAAKSLLPIEPTAVMASSGVAAAHAIGSTLDDNDALGCAVRLAVLKIAKHDTAFDLTPMAVASLADLVMVVARFMARDLSCFCRHAGRKTVTVPDVLLLARKLPPNLQEQFSTFCSNLNDQQNEKVEVTRKASGMRQQVGVAKKQNRPAGRRKEKLEANDTSSTSSSSLSMNGVHANAHASKAVGQFSSSDDSSQDSAVKRSKALLKRHYVAQAAAAKKATTPRSKETSKKKRSRSGKKRARNGVDASPQVFVLDSPPSLPTMPSLAPLSGVENKRPATMKKRFRLGQEGHGVDLVDNHESSKVSAFNHRIQKPTGASRVREILSTMDHDDSGTDEYSFA
jgi:histone H3/H4